MSTASETKMNISDIPKESTLVIVAADGKKKMELPAEFAELSSAEQSEIEVKFSNDVIVIENIMQQWQEKLVEVSFEGKISDLELIAVTKAGVFRWKKIRVYKYKLSNERNVQLIYSKKLEGEKYNRRRGVRVILDRRMDVEQNGQSYSVVVKDLSYCGVSFLEPLGSQINPEEPFILKLSEDSEKGDEIVASIKGKILHQREAESGGVFSGCVLSPEHAAYLQKYVAIKQMERISGKRQYQGVTKLMTGEDWELDMADALKKL